MANPQLENGHIRIAHELYRAAMRKLTPTEFMVWAAIADETYGWSKKSAAISYGRLSVATGMHRTKVIEYVARLKKRGVVWVQNRDDNSNIIGIVKDYEKWQPSSCLATTAKGEKTPPLVAVSLLATSSCLATTPSSCLATPLQPVESTSGKPFITNTSAHVPKEDKALVSSTLRTTESNEADSAILSDCWKKINERWPGMFGMQVRETIRGLIIETNWRCVRDATKNALSNNPQNPIAYIKSEARRMHKQVAQNV